MFFFFLPLQVHCLRETFHPNAADPSIEAKGKRSSLTMPSSGVHSPGMMRTQTDMAKLKTPKEMGRICFIF